MWLLLAAVSHFSMIGYPVATQSPEALGADLQRYSEHCESVPLDAGHRACLVADASGAELWIGLADKPGQLPELVTANPALRGNSRTKIIVTGTSSAPDWRPFEIVVQADFAGARTPMVFEIADPRETPRFKSGAALEVDITAFPRELEFFDSEKAYDESQRDAKVRFAPNHFIPSGMFTDGKSSEGPAAEALFAGTILDSELRRNERTGAQYWLIRVRTYDEAVFNVVADPSQVKGKPPTGWILAGSFWMSGRLAKP